MHSPFPQATQSAQAITYADLSACKSWPECLAFDAKVSMQLGLKRLDWMELIYSVRMQSTPLLKVWGMAWYLAFEKNEGAMAQAACWYAPVRRFGLSLAQQVELDMGDKLPYHNPSHIADMLIIMGALLGTWREMSATSPTPQHDAIATTPVWQKQDAALCLLAALAHDWGHDGGSAFRAVRLEDLALTHLIKAIQQGFEQELGRDAEGQDLLNPIEELLGQNWQAKLFSVFDATHPAQSRSYHLNHERERETKSLTGERMAPLVLTTVLMNEADVGASVLPAYGDFLNVQALSEIHQTKLRSQVAAVSTNQAEEIKLCIPKPMRLGQVAMIPSRRTFLNELVFSSPMSAYLGLPQLLHATLFMTGTVES
jgi:hypothetical protein